mgnify:FL=1
MFGIGMTYGILMAISRIRIGAHFTSDVTMSLLIMFSLMVIADFIINQVISRHKNKLSKD